MIAFLRGNILEKGEGRAVLEVGGIGYEVFLAPSSSARLPDNGETAELFIVESMGLYGGTTTLYGFLTREEKELFLCFKDNLPSTGAKKALEYLDKATRSLPDFRRAVLDQDARILSNVFGFTRKTAERLLAGLKDKLGKVHIPGEPRLSFAGTSSLAAPMAQALEALASLGYRPSECRQALEAVQKELSGRAQEARVEEILRLALRKL
jgi:Holliday junction DNA helicase RuvA